MVGRSVGWMDGYDASLLFQCMVIAEVGRAILTL